MGTETGPFRMAANTNASSSSSSSSSGRLEAASVRWTSIASMLFLDQPYGTGFSFAARNASDAVVHDEMELRDAASAAVLQFFKRHPQYAFRPFYIFGESFAGHMAPNIAYR